MEKDVKAEYLETLERIMRGEIGNPQHAESAEEKMEWEDDQHGYLFLNRRGLPDDSRADDIEETPRIGAN